MSTQARVQYGNMTLVDHNEDGSWWFAENTEVEFSVDRQYLIDRGIELPPLPKKSFLTILSSLGFENALLSRAVKDELWEIRINGTPVNFGGKRLFKSKGAAKSTLTRTAIQCISQSSYISHYNKLTKPFDWLALSAATRKEFGANQNSGSEPISKVASEITKRLIDAGVITITQTT